MSIVGVLALGLIVVGVVLAVRRFTDRRADGSDDGNDVIAYLLLAAAVGTAGFSLASLANAAFPAGTFVLDRSQQVSIALAGVVVAAPIAAIFWRRQAERRSQYPESAGWALYLTVIEAVFMTALVISGFNFLNWLIGDGSSATWANVLIYAGIVTYHELESRRTPPMGDSRELPRVVGSAIGLIATVTAVTGLLTWLFETAYATFTPRVGGEEPLTWLALLIVALPVWYRRWRLPWPAEPQFSRNAWLFVASAAGIAIAIGAAVYTAGQTLIFFATNAGEAGRHFGFLPAAVAMGAVSIGVWAHHRSQMGTERSDTVRAYRYALAALGLAALVGSATALTALALGSGDFVGTQTEGVIASALTAMVALWVWWHFWSGSSEMAREEDVATTPRRMYLLGLAVVMGLISAGALTAVLVVLFQIIIEGNVDGSDMAIQAPLFVYAGIATWHLLRENAADRALVESDESITPFTVTIVCSHPGTISAMFHERAQIHVIYRADDAGRITPEMASEIVAEVGHRSSLVWVDDDGYRIAPAN